MVYFDRPSGIVELEFGRCSVLIFARIHRVKSRTKPDHKPQNRPSPWAVPRPYGPADRRHRRTRTAIPPRTPPAMPRRGGPVRFGRRAALRRRIHHHRDRRRRGRGEVGLPDRAEAHPAANQRPHPLTNPYGEGRSRSTPPAGPSRPPEYVQHIAHLLGFSRLDPIPVGSQRALQTTPAPKPRLQTP